MVAQEKIQKQNDEIEKLQENNQALSEAKLTLNQRIEATEQLLEDHQSTDSNSRKKMFLKIMKFSISKKYEKIFYNHNAMPIRATGNPNGQRSGKDLNNLNRENLIQWVD